MKNITLNTSNGKSGVTENSNFCGNNRQHVEQTLKFLFRHDETFEICLIGPKVQNSPLWANEWAGGKKAIVAGWFDDIARAADLIVHADQAVSPAGIYCTLNPVNPVLLGRANNRLKEHMLPAQRTKRLPLSAIFSLTLTRSGHQTFAAQTLKKHPPLICCAKSELTCAIQAGRSLCLPTAATVGI
jgi:hypothetical protein